MWDCGSAVHSVSSQAQTTASTAQLVHNACKRITRHIKMKLRETCDESYMAICQSSSQLFQTSGKRQNKKTNRFSSLGFFKFFLFIYLFFNLISISIKNKNWMDILWRPSLSIPFLWKATKHYKILQDSGFSSTPIKLSYVSACVI